MDIQPSMDLEEFDDIRKFNPEYIQTTEQEDSVKKYLEL